MPKLQAFGQRMVDPGEISRENINRNQQMADLILAQSANPQIQHPTQGLALLMNAFNSQAYRQRAKRGEDALKAQEAKQMGDFLNSLNLPPEQRAIAESAPPELQRQILAQAAGQRFAPQEQAEPNLKASPIDLSKWDPESVQRALAADNAGLLVPRGTDGISGVGQRVIDGAEMEVYKDEQGLPFVLTAPDINSRRYLTSAEMTTPVQRNQNLPFQDDAPIPERVEVPPEQTLLALAEHATGIGSTVQAAGSRIPGVPVGQEAVYARTQFNLARQQLMSALRGNEATRPLALEMEQLFEAMPISPRLIDQPENLRANLYSIKDELNLRIAQASRDSIDGRLPESTRTGQRAAASAMQNFVDRIGERETPNNANGMPDLSTMSDEELRRLAGVE